MILNLNMIKVLLKAMLIINLYSLLFSTDIYINEIMSSNLTTIYTSDGGTPDWIELYNSSDYNINLSGYGLSDNLDEPFKWIFPNTNIGPTEYLLVFASGDDITINNHWETIIDWGDNWKYLVGNEEPSIYWRRLEFDDSIWSDGASGFGYGDNDDMTVIPQTISVYLRKTFEIEDLDNILDMVLHVDFDDAFVAYINNIEIARANIGTPGIPPSFNQGANEWHEAAIYSGGLPDRFDLDTYLSSLQNGQNILAIQAHNYDQSSSDLSIIPFLTFGMENAPSNPQGSAEILNFENSNLHTNFKISSSGEDILITRPDNVIEDHLESIQIPSDVSFGRDIDNLDNLLFYSSPTPDAPNSTQGYNEFCGVPDFSIDGGLFSGGVNLSLSSDLNDFNIYYSLDGSDPTSESLLYTNEIQILETTVIKASIISNNCYSTSFKTQTYLINEAANLPIISLSTDPENLWNNDTGIYVLGDNASDDIPFFGANFWEDWEKPSHIEFFESDGSLGFSLDVGIKIFGGWSRANAQKSLAIFARSEYGSNKIEYKIFPEKNIESFKSIVLRNSGNDWYSGNNWSTNSMLRDGMATGLMNDSGVDHQAYRPAILYINGEYWGIHNIREKVNEDFLAANNPGVDPDELDQLELSGEVVEGSNTDYLNLINFIENNSLELSEDYSYVKEEIDIDNFIDYNIAQIFYANTDWPGNNIKFWRPHIEGSKWKWILYDTDFGFSLVQWYGHNTLEFALDPNGPGWPNPSWSTFLLRSLMENPDFQNQFISHFCFYLSSRFSTENVHDHIINTISNIENEMPNHINKWGGNMSQWYQNLNTIITFGDLRTNNVYTHLRSYFGLLEISEITISIYPDEAGSIITSNQNIPENPWSAQYFNGIPIELEAIPNPGYIFSHWEEDISNDENTITVSLSGEMNLKAVFIEDIDPPTILINELMSSNESTIEDENGQYEDWIEIYYNTDQTINLSGYSLSDNINNSNMWIIPDLEIYGEGYLLFWADNDLEDGPFHTNFQLSSSGEEVALFDRNQNLVDFILYDNLDDDISYGRVTDGSDNWQMFTSPSPGSTNIEEECSLGDLNQDNMQNVLDIVELVNCILASNCDGCEADLNEDGLYNVLDVVFLANSILNL